MDVKRDIHLAITFIVGMLAIGEYYTGIEAITATFTIVKNWGIVLQGFALGLGAVNLFRVHGSRVSTRKRDDWMFSAWLLLMLVVFVFFGLSTGEYDQGATYSWLYNAFYLPLGATMYSSLAFYMAYGSYKVLRARNFDAALLFITAVLVIMGNTPLFPTIYPGFFHMREWIFGPIVSGAYRGVRIGIGMGAVVLGIRTLLGMETGYLGRH